MSFQKCFLESYFPTSHIPLDKKKTQTKMVNPKEIRALGPSFLKMS